VKYSFDPHAYTVGTSEKVPLAQVFHDNQPTQFDRGASRVGWQNDELLRTLDPEQLLYLPLSVEQGCLGCLRSSRVRPGRSLRTTGAWRTSCQAGRHT